MNCVIKNEALALLVIESRDNSTKLLMEYIKNRLDLNDQQSNAIGEKLSRIFIPTCLRKWKNSFYIQDKFMRDNQLWLESEFTIPDKSVNCGKKKEKNFADCSEKTKKRRLQAFAESCNNEVEIKLTSESRQQENVKISRNSAKDQNIKPVSPEVGLGLLVNSRLTKFQYDGIRALLKENNVDVLPTYKKLAETKTECYPDSSAISITESSATVELQAVLDHTVERLFKIPNVIPSELNKRKRLTLRMISKWGCDGASGLSTFKQRFSDPSCSDESIFSVAFVPLQVSTRSDKPIVVWKNPVPGSIVYCRPIKFDFSKETASKTLAEYDDIETQIKHLKPTKIRNEKCEITVQHELQCTMIDGKVVTVISGTSSASVCCICGSKPSEMNNLDKLRHTSGQNDVTSLQFGLSTLHAWIRFMECILHIAYRINIQKWTVKKDNKDLMEATKRRIQQEFREKLGLLVDVPKQGSGTSNDGNTARKFFTNFKITSEITHVDEQLIYRFYVILQTMASAEDIDVEKFENYAFQTAQFFVSQYPWFYMPASVHKVLLHGAQVIETLSLPLGYYTEESLEARNKVVKSTREHGTRKDSRIHTNTDLLHFLLASSDPYIVHLRTVKEKKKQVCFKTVRNC